MIKCKRCKTDKNSSEFYPKKGTASGLNPWCKPCVLSANKEWRDSDPERTREKNREANRRYHNSELGRLAARRKAAKRYGLTIEQYDKILMANGGTCPICEERPATHIDHCHNTERVRGALCGPCNAALGAFNDSVEALERAKQYLADVSPHPDKM